MFLDFFLLLRQRGLPVSFTEHLTLLDALRRDIGDASIESFYFLSKTTLVKREQHLDLFDQVFADWLAGQQIQEVEALPEVPPDWLNEALLRELTDDERALLEAIGGLDALWSQLKKLLDEQTGRHEGGNRWVGTGGTSPFGVMGANPEGFRMDKGQPGKGNRSAVNVWEQREYKNYDDGLELNTRNLKMALRRLRILTREGIEDELDIAGTIEETSRNAGMLDIRLQPSRKNQVKVLILFDVGGSMDEHVDLCKQLFSAARYQFKHLAFYYFHNCVYETLWRDNRGAGDRRRDRISTWEVLHRYNRDYKVIFVGDASMASYEITQPKGSVEHYNEEAGMVWLDRFKTQFPCLVWLNPTVSAYWQYTHSISLIRNWSDNRMFPLTLNGLTQAMKCLKNPKVKFE